MSDVVAYLRVSTDAQVDAEGLGVQRDGISAWAEAHGKRIVQWCSDEGESGSNGLETRVELYDALQVAKDGVGLVVWRLDRLSRDVILQESLLRTIWSQGGLVFSTAEGEQSVLADDPADPSRRLIRVVLGAVNEYERAMITLRMAAGRRRKAERGGYAGGAPPFGWAAVDKELVEVPEEQEVRSQILALRRGRSLRQVAEEANRRGFRTRRGGAWSSSSVHRLVKGG